MKIRRDVHGLYIRLDGHVFRPEMSDTTYPAWWNRHGRGIETGFAEGDEVKAKHLSQTTLAKVRRDGVEEYWNSHGHYLTGLVTFKSDVCWRPKQDTRKKHGQEN